MRIAYLLHYMGKNYEEISENIDQLIDGGDDVFVMINEEKLRDDIFMAYASVPEMHLCTTQPAALPADLSMPRGHLLAIKTALEAEEDQDVYYDYFINLSDGMMPVVSREKIVAFLEGLNGKDAAHLGTDSETDPTLKERFEDYAFFTNSFDFQRSRMIQGMNSLTTRAVRSFKKREMEDVLVKTWPWFVLSHASAQDLCDNFGYCSQTFMMSLYPEELAVGTMLRKFSDNELVDADIWCVGENGDYHWQSPVKATSRDALARKPEALFAGPIRVDENVSLYSEYFDRYAGQ